MSYSRFPQLGDWFSDLMSEAGGITPAQATKAAAALFPDTYKQVESAVQAGAMEQAKSYTQQAATNPIVWVAIGALGLVIAGQFVGRKR